MKISNRIKSQIAQKFRSEMQPQNIKYLYL